MPLARGEVVAVPYPFTDLSGSKTRPALVVSTDGYNRTRPDVLVSAISTQLGRVTQFDHVLVDWRAAGLRYPSVVKGRVVTLAQTLVLRTVGRLSGADQAAYDQRLVAFLTTDTSITEAFLQRTLWTSLRGQQLQMLAEGVLTAHAAVAPLDPNCDVQRLRALLPP